MGKKTWYLKTWVTNEEFFDAELKRLFPFLPILMNSMAIPCLIACILSTGETWIVGLAMFVGLNLYVMCEFLRLKSWKKVPREFILWDSCCSRRPVEPWRNIAHVLTENGIGFHDLSKKEIEKEKRWIGNPRYSLRLDKEHIFIEFWWSGTLSGFFNSEFSHWVCVRAQEEGVDSQLLNEVTQLIEEQVKELPDSNPFCRNCNKSQDATCYGPDVMTLGQADPIRDLETLLRQIDPYRNEETFTELVEKKKKLDKETYNVEGFENEFRKYLEKEEN